MNAQQLFDEYQSAFYGFVAVSSAFHATDSDALKNQLYPVLVEYAGALQECTRALLAETQLEVSQ